ncbi:UDP-glucuronosyltransferase 2B13-like [Scaptodrosophila lebanonensis]|uniref:UDP-glucuronosyltransferase n=1 Tax=Drosophila lebanonensis TaxID=7225 RepID=A0A6J2TDZ4_DROLE|nr:UDP-glucuronosyltransferase 2B13-like [Scaptodrosophila lebanonensis]
MKSLVVYLLTLISLLSHVQSAKILATFPFPGRSQYIFAESYLKALAARGHEVTVINTLPNKSTPNMRFISAPKIHEYFDEMMKEISAPTLWQQLNGYNRILTKVTECTMNDLGVQKLLQSGETFDLVIAETVQTEALFGLAQHFNATLIGLSSYGTDWEIDKLMGNTSPLSYNPPVTSSRTQHMNFYERLQNLYEFILTEVHWVLVHLPVMQRLYDKYFPNAKQTMAEVLGSFKLMLLGQHFTLSHSRPYVPNMIEVGGLHISHKPAPLPEQIKQFIEAAPHGVIYFSMGSNVKSKDLPQETREMLLKVFGRLKQRVLWKFEDNQLPGKPDNVFISKWFPQPDILAHPQVKLFITHGGLLSTIESVYFGKPVLGLPVFYDQFMNVERARRMGFGLGLSLINMEEKQFEEAIQTLLNTASFAQASALISERYRDQPETSLERAIWWTEYVIRHKGASHMRVAAMDLNFIQIHSLDTLGVLIGIPVLFLLLIGYLSCTMMRRGTGFKTKRLLAKQKKN